MRKIVLSLSVLALLASAGLAVAGVSVEDAVICASVADRSPQGAASDFPPDAGRIYAFTRVVGMEAPGSVTHRWSYRGGTVAEVPLDVGSPSWRTWSSKEVMGHQTGAWKVEVLDGAGNVLKTMEFTVGGAGDAEKSR